jgi:hypothetical protein
VRVRGVRLTQGGAGVPIIIVPGGAATLVTRYNVRDLLEGSKCARCLPCHGPS